MGNKKSKELKDMKMCKIAKKELIEDNLECYIKLVKKPEYICKRCGRAAKSEKQLCKPVAINDKNS